MASRSSTIVEVNGPLASAAARNCPPRSGDRSCADCRFEIERLHPARSRASGPRSNQARRRNLRGLRNSDQTGYSTPLRRLVSSRRGTVGASVGEGISPVPEGIGSLSRRRTPHAPCRLRRQPARAFPIRLPPGRTIGACHAAMTAACFICSLAVAGRTRA